MITPKYHHVSLLNRNIPTQVVGRHYHSRCILPTFSNSPWVATSAQFTNICGTTDTQSLTHFFSFSYYERLSKHKIQEQHRKFPAPDCVWPMRWFTGDSCRETKLKPKKSCWSPYTLNANIMYIYVYTHIKNSGPLIMQESDASLSHNKSCMNGR